jgi:hypothetical protein
VCRETVRERCAMQGGVCSAHLQNITEGLVDWGKPAMELLKVK